MAKPKDGEIRVEFVLPADLEIRLRQIALASTPPRRNLQQFLRDLAAAAQPLGPIEAAATVEAR